MSRKKPDLITAFNVAGGCFLFSIGAPFYAVNIACHFLIAASKAYEEKMTKEISLLQKQQEKSQEFITDLLLIARDTQEFVAITQQKIESIETHADQRPKGNLHFKLDYKKTNRLVDREVEKLEMLLEDNDQKFALIQESVNEIFSKETKEPFWPLFKKHVCRVW